MVAADNLYGGSYNLITHTLAAQGITHTIVRVNDPVALEASIRPNTKAVFVETFGNPNSDVLNLDGVSEIAHRHGVPVIVDNTFATPYLFRPLEHGADIVVHSATKFIGGHGISLGGVIVDGGRFDWKAYPNKFPTLAKPEPSYHGAVFADVPVHPPSSPASVRSSFAIQVPPFRHSMRSSCCRGWRPFRYVLSAMWQMR